MPSILERIIHPEPQAGRPDAWSDYWYSPVSRPTHAGVNITPATAMTIGAVYACVRVIAETIASLPLLLYERLDREGRRRVAYDDSLFQILNVQPNEFQTRMEFVEMMVGHALLRGNAYAHIGWDARGEVESLIPLDPTRMIKVELLPTGRVRYMYQERSGEPTPYLQDEIFHLKGFSSNGLTGISVVTLARESFGLTLAAEDYGARFFAQDATPPGVLEHPEKLSAESSNRIQSSWQKARSGLRNAHKVAVLEEGMKWQAVGLSNEDAQFLSTRQFQTEEVARWFRVPLHIISSTTKATSWGTGLESLSLGFVVYTLRPWLVRYEQTNHKSLLTEPNQFTEFLVDALLRGNIKDRYVAYKTGVQWGWLSRNEVRRFENMNPAEGLDEYLVPLNMGIAGDEASQISNGSTALALKAGVLATELAGRIVRKEIKAISTQAKRLTDDPEAFLSFLEEFYAEHVEHVAITMGLEEDVAKTYCNAGLEAVRWHNVKILESWEAERIPYLAALALAHEQE